jgi:Skp family chaperone for outer membrane proteins
MLFFRERTAKRKPLILAAAALAAIFLSANLSTGQAPNAAVQSPHSAGANASKSGVAVVDISYIFKNHARFRAAMDAMKQEMDGIEAQLKSKRDQITKLEEQRNKFQPGANEYKELDNQLAKQMADFNVEMNRLRKDFLDREAKEYYQTYLGVVDAVSRYATRRGISLVIRFNGEAVDPNRREDVLREINKPVVFQNYIDITPDVLSEVNRDTAAAMRPATPGAAGMSIPR